MKKLKLRNIYFIPAIATMAILGNSCTAVIKPQQGASIGVGAGGTVGALIGRAAGNTALGAIIGGAIGGTAGAYIGRKIDRQAGEIKRAVPGTTITRTNSGFLLNFDSPITFDQGQSDLNSAEQSNLEKLAVALKKNPEADVLVAGHTDSTENTGLSVKRAETVKNFIIANGVNAARLTTSAVGATEPAASNSAPGASAEKRRVDIIILSNNHPKK